MRAIDKRYLPPPMVLVGEQLQDPPGENGGRKDDHFGASGSILYVCVRMRHVPQWRISVKGRGQGQGVRSYVLEAARLGAFSAGPMVTEGDRRIRAGVGDHAASAWLRPNDCPSPDRFS
jgi:hypothetical protein